MLWGQEPNQSLESLFLPDQIDRSVTRGIEFLVQTQRVDGVIADRGNEVAMTSLAIMAMAAIGTVPTPETKAGRAMQSAIDFVLHQGNQDAQGYLGSRDQSRMYGHGITTLMLTEVLGMADTPEENKRIHDVAL